MHQQQWTRAVENFQMASARAEKWVYPHYNLARVYTGQQKYRKAEQELKKGIAIGNELGLKYSYLYYNLGVLYLFQGRSLEAEQQFRRSIEMKPDDAMSYHNLGLVFEKRGDERQAEKNFQKAAELDPKLIEPRKKLAEIYRKQKREDMRDRMLQKAVAAAADPQSAGSMKPPSFMEARKIPSPPLDKVKILMSYSSELH
jgi:tetratricopeptide (TPR) repeat protein